MFLTGCGLDDALSPNFSHALAHIKQAVSKSIINRQAVAPGNIKTDSIVRDNDLKSFRATGHFDGGEGRFGMFQCVGPGFMHDRKQMMAHLRRNRMRRQ